MRVATSGGTSVALSDLAQTGQRGVPEPCPFGAPAGAVLVDLRLHEHADVGAIRGAIEAARSAAPTGTTVEITHAPVVYDVALAGTIGDDAAIRALATAWRTQLAAAPGIAAVEADAPPVTAWTIDRNAALRPDLDASDVNAAVTAMNDGVRVAQIADHLVGTPVYLRVEPPDPARIVVHIGDRTTALSSLATRRTGPGRFDTIDARPAVIVRFTVADADDPDAVAADAIARARAAAPPGAMTVTSWRDL